MSLGSVGRETPKITEPSIKQLHATHSIVGVVFPLMVLPIVVTVYGSCLQLSRHCTLVVARCVNGAPCVANDNREEKSGRPLPQRTPLADEFVTSLWFCDA